MTGIANHYKYRKYLETQKDVLSEELKENIENWNRKSILEKVVYHIGEVFLMQDTEMEVEAAEKILEKRNYLKQYQFFPSNELEIIVEEWNQAWKESQNKSFFQKMLWSVKNADLASKASVAREILEKRKSYEIQKK